jgi:hypothetical protein
MFTLHKRIEQSKHSEVKGIKKGIKNFCPSLYGWEGMCLSVCHFHPNQTFAKVYPLRVPVRYSLGETPVLPAIIRQGPNDIKLFTAIIYEGS